MDAAAEQRLDAEGEAARAQRRRQGWVVEPYPAILNALKQQGTLVKNHSFYIEEPARGRFMFPNFNENQNLLFFYQNHSALWQAEQGK